VEPLPYRRNIDAASCDQKRIKIREKPEIFIDSIRS
jgi:hypothetical protein